MKSVGQKLIAVHYFHDVKIMDCPIALDEFMKTRSLADDGENFAVCAENQEFEKNRVISTAFTNRTPYQKRC